MTVFILLLTVEPPRKRRHGSPKSIIWSAHWSTTEHSTLLLPCWTCTFTESQGLAYHGVRKVPCPACWSCTALSHGVGRPLSSSKHGCQRDKDYDERMQLEKYPLLITLKILKATGTVIPGQAQTAAFRRLIVVLPLLADQNTTRLRLTSCLFRQNPRMSSHEPTRPFPKQRSHATTWARRADQHVFGTAQNIASEFMLSSQANPMLCG